MSSIAYKDKKYVSKVQFSYFNDEQLYFLFIYSLFLYNVYVSPFFLANEF